MVGKNNLLLKIRNKDFKNTFITFLGSITSRGLNFATTIIIAKELNVHDYGIFILLISITTTITEIINSGINVTTIRYVAIYHKENDFKKLNELITSTFINISIFSLLIFIFILLLSNLISNNILHGNYVNLIYISALGVFPAFYFSLISGILQGLQEFNKNAIYNIIYAVFRIFPLVIMIFCNLVNINMLTILFNISPMVTFIIGIYLIRKNIRIKIFYNFKLIIEVLKFSKWVFLWSIITVIQNRLDIFLLGSFLSANQVSYFDIAQKFVSIVLMPMASYATVLNPKISSVKDKKLLYIEFKKSFKFIKILCLFLIVSIGILPILISLIFGSKYNNSIPLLIIMLSSCFFYLLTLPYNSTIFAFGKSQAFFYTSILTLIVNTITSIILLPRIGVLGSAISFFLVNLFSFLSSKFYFNYYMNRKNDLLMEHK